jgi:hypothetical protein
VAVAAAIALDVGSILVFVAIGRSSHQHGVTTGGMASTSWPFLMGAACGWGAIRAWRRPLRIAPSGVVIWITCVVVGMALRVVAGQGTALAFVIVALAFLGMMLLGWRVGVRALTTVGATGAVAPTGESARGLSGD